MNNGRGKASPKAECKAKIELNVTKDKVFLNLDVPYKWVILVIITALIWRMPDLWEAVRLALPLLNK